MAVELIPIKVKLEIAAGNEKPFNEATELKVGAMCITPIELKPKSGKGGAPVEVPVIPEIHPDKFLFLLIRPVTVGGEPFKPGQLDKLRISYSTEAGCSEKQRKPLKATHVFHSGQTEWITDKLGKDEPGPLKVLFFWNEGEEPAPLTEEEMKAFKTPEELKKGKEKQKASKDVTLQIITGYMPTKG